MSSPAQSLKDACRLFLIDLEALPEDAFDRRFAPKARTVADIVYEVNLVNDHVGMVIRNETPFEWPGGGWPTAPENLRTKDEVVASFKASSDRIVATAEGFTPEQMAAPLVTEEGTTDRAERCRFMVVHLWYHLGQLNFVQTLLGDDAWHWAPK